MNVSSLFLFALPDAMSAKPILVRTQSKQIRPEVRQSLSTDEGYDLMEDESKVQTPQSKTRGASAPLQTVQLPACRAISKSTKYPLYPSLQTDPAVQLQIDTIRKLLLEKESRNFGHANQSVKHAYTFFNSVVDSSTPALGCFNDLAQGTGNGQRTSISQYNHGVTARLVFRIIPTGVALANLAWQTPPICRVMVWVDKVPTTVPPTISQTMEFTSGVPTSGATPWTSPAAATLGMMTAFRSNLNFDKFHVLHDETIIPEAYGTQVISATSVFYDQAVWKHRFHLDLKKIVSEYGATTAVSLITNACNYAIFCDRVSGAGCSIEASFDFTFSDADNT